MLLADPRPSGAPICTSVKEVSSTTGLTATNPPVPSDFVSENQLPFPEFLHHIDIHVIRPHCQVRGAVTVVYIYRNVRFGMALGSTHCYVPLLPLFSVKERE